MNKNIFSIRLYQDGRLLQVWDGLDEGRARRIFRWYGRYLRFYEGENGFEVHIRPSDLLDTRNIAEVSVGTGGKVQLKLYSKERALFKLWEILHQEDGEPVDAGILEALRSLDCEPGNAAD